MPYTYPLEAESEEEKHWREWVDVSVFPLTKQDGKPKVVIIEDGDKLRVDYTSADIHYAMEILAAAICELSDRLKPE